jgi:hypothetical protein
MAFYVLLNGSYDSTFVGAFRTERAADQFASLHENDAVGAFVLNHKQMRANIRNYGACPIVRPDHYDETVLTTPRPRPSI